MHIIQGDVSHTDRQDKETSVPQTRESALLTLVSASEAKTWATEVPMETVSAMRAPKVVLKKMGGFWFRRMFTVTTALEADARGVGRPLSRKETVI